MLDVGIGLAMCYVTLQTSSPLKNVFLLAIDLLLLEVYLVFTIHLESGVSFNCVWGLVLYLVAKALKFLDTPSDKN